MKNVFDGQIFEMLRLKYIIGDFLRDASFMDVE
jgi:hypothetical protein